MELIVQALETQYYIHKDVLLAWDYGDGSYRKRLFICGFCRALGKAAREFKFPAPIFDINKSHTARDIALPDKYVERQYWRADNTKRTTTGSRSPGRIHTIASTGEGMGPASNPNKVISWDGTMGSPTTYNGNNKFPSLQWIVNSLVYSINMICTKTTVDWLFDGAF